MDGASSQTGHGGVQTFRVSAKSPPNALAGAVAGVLRASGKLEIRAIGAGAVNQAVKALAVAQSYVAPEGIDVVSRVAFEDVQVDGAPRTAIVLKVEDRNASEVHGAETQEGEATA